MPVDHLSNGAILDVTLFELSYQSVVKLDHGSIGRASMEIELPVDGRQVLMDGVETLGLFLGKIEPVHQVAHVARESVSSVVAVTSASLMHLRRHRVQVLQERSAAVARVSVSGFDCGSGGEAAEGYEGHGQDDRQDLKLSVCHLELSCGIDRGAGSVRPLGENSRWRLFPACVPLVVIGEGLFRNIARPAA
jgi:hypothetical protein